MRPLGLLILLTGCAATRDTASEVPAQTLAGLVEETRRELGDGFSIRTCLDLFVVACDGDDLTMRRGLLTIEEVVGALRKDFVKTPPAEPLRVYLFCSKKSYDEYNLKAYGHEPSTPYGFYMRSQRKLIMNIRTGLGTLAHELVHPYNEADFPSIPAWFNEGFASLHEQSRNLPDGSMRGEVNWRLPGLQEAHFRGTAPSLRSVIQSSTSSFYDDHPGLNYAVARYLCYYLQEHGLLAKYYAAFRDSAKADPTGLATLESVLGRDVEVFEPTFQKFVSRLEFR